MGRKLDHGRLRAELLGFLAQVGSATAAEACGRLGISQPAFSRLSQELRPDLVIASRARATRYAARREVSGVGRSLPIYEIDAQGGARQLAILHAIQSRGFHVQALCADIDSGFHADLPWFLHDHRPAGFLGRLIPRRHPELGLPQDVRDWSGDDCLRYLSRHGWSLVGSLVLGDEAFRLHLAHAQAPPDMVEAGARKREYPRLADDALSAGAPGSSAGGEQPKFLVSRLPGPVSVLAKFSPDLGEPTGRRWGDLLVCEHLAHQVLAEHGQAAARSELLEAGGRLFLEVERFDRVGGRGRRGLLSLAALDLEHVGRMRNWTDSAEALLGLGLLTRPLCERIRFSACFGRLMADSDMHLGNLAFVTRGTRLVELAPAYDRVPMLYAPEGGNLVRREFRPAMPSPAERGVWAEACRAAAELWSRAASHPLLSEGFRDQARENADRVASLADLSALLPEP